VPVEVDGVSISTRVVATGLATPVFLASPPGDPCLFVLEKAGHIRIPENGVVSPAPFLDISAMVASDSERGLLGLAFDPNYSTNGRLFIDYIAAQSGTVMLASLQVSGDPNLADAQTLTAILTIPHPKWRLDRLRSRRISLHGRW
jgi:glucose/arabinose dehydrogenase